MMQHLSGKFQKAAAAFIAFLVLYSCANIVAPTGGPRDEDPPVVLSSNPPNFSPNFKGNQFRIFFDEFVQLKDINQKLLISPPFEKQPEVRIRGKSIIVQFDEELRENTTYNFFFGDAIVDNNEGNAIPNFQFVFSTGPYVDSLSIAGKVNDAFSLKPSAGIYVMLYDNIYDSVPYLERPVYLAKTDKEGNFGISNIREGQYKIFAIEDLNANFQYDLPNERIAFLDSLIIPKFVEPPTIIEDHDLDHDHDLEHDHGHEHDHIGVPGIEIMPVDVPPVQPGVPDLFLQAGDTHVADTVPVAAQPRQTRYHLRLFQEADTVQRILSTSLVRVGLLQMAFRVPFDSIAVRDLSEQLPEKWFLPEPSKNRDTLLLWLLPPIADSLNIEVSDRGLVLDTLKLSARPREVRGRGATLEADPKVSLRLNATRGSALPFFEALTITAGNPIERLDTAAIHIMTADSVWVEPNFEFIGTVQRRLELITALEQDESYSIEILPGAFTDIFGHANDTLRANFKTTRFEDYGMIILNLGIEEALGQFILQLLDKDGKPLIEKVIPGAGAYEFKNLQPGNYGLRLIHDMNANGKWDTGHYLRKIQPEPVYIYDGVLQIRQNWESEMNWDVNL